MNIQEKLKVVFAEKAGISLEEVTTDTSLSSIAEDSLSKIDFLFELEQLVGKRIPENDVIEAETFGDLLHIINKIS